MITLCAPQQIKDYLKSAKKMGKTIGLVPTMGSLHQGHISLIEQASQQCDLVVVSIFVNPSQFNDQIDLANYPRNKIADEKIAQQAGCDVLFYPSVQDMYPNKYNTWVLVDGLDDILEGKFRPGHFRGVATIVTKLFGIINPDKAYFGEKDFQQLAVVERLVKDLFLSIEIIRCPTLREETGLALSSRNIGLDQKAKLQAQLLFQAMLKAREEVELGNEDVDSIKTFVKQFLKKDLINLEYVEIINPADFSIADKAIPGYRILLAAKVGQVRLIDNLEL